jgi:alanyl-tRNA synthetase
VRYRKVKTKTKELYNVVLNKTPFYSESGGQVGDKGRLFNINEQIVIFDTKKENGVIIHFTDMLPENLNADFTAAIDTGRRLAITNNHSATHLLHAALRKVLGTHVEQKGSLVNDEYLRFDFSHFSKVSDKEIQKIEKIVNAKIRKNIKRKVELMSIDDAKKSGAMALFGEKYGDIVRVVTFDKNYSIELCGGAHVKATGQIGFFKIVSESAVAAGIRRIEAITSLKAEEYINEQLRLIGELKAVLKGSKDVVKSVESLMEENTEMQKQIGFFLKEKAQQLKKELKQQISLKNGINFLATTVQFNNAEEIKNILFEIKNEVENCFIVLGAEVNGKPSISVILSDNLVKDKGLNAGAIVKDLAKEINGGGGGQAFYAQAGGSKPEGLKNAIEKAKAITD